MRYNIEKEKSPIKSKSYGFALRAVKLSQYLVSKHKEFILSKQILKSGTSIGANVTEAGRGESMPDFAHKMSIALKEAEETEYWLNLLLDSQYISEKEFRSLDEDCSQVIKLLKSIVKTSNSKKKKKQK